MRNKNVAAEAMAAAGSTEAARDIAAIDSAADAASQKLAQRTGGDIKHSLVERLIYGSVTETDDFNTVFRDHSEETRKKILSSVLGLLAEGKAFTTDGKLSHELRSLVANDGAYGFIVSKALGGQGFNFQELALLEEELAANGFGGLAVEISGQLTIGAGSLLGYGDESQQSLFLPMIASGRLMAFGLTEVGTGVNAKKVQAYVEWDQDAGVYRLFADGPRAKFYITNATYGSLCGVVCRIGKSGKEVGLFIVELPERDIDEEGVFFRISSSGAGAFQENWNSRIEFAGYPIPARNRIQADGVEVLFYCLRMGRCMLAAMSSGYQKMFAADAMAYAKTRPGVGGLVIHHELPQLNLATIMAGAFASQALSHLSLAQDAQGVDLAGLRDITKSVASGTARASQEAAEKVVGGRSFDVDSRIHKARHNMHVFGVVEGQDDLILMGMVKDVTSRFTNQYLAPLLSILTDLNPPTSKTRILRIGFSETLQNPWAVAKASWRLFYNPGFWSLVGWILRNSALEIPYKLSGLLPGWLIGRFAWVPKDLRPYARWAESELRRQKWVYLVMNGYYQLELTKAQLPILMFGRRIEKLVAMLAVCYHAIDKTEHEIAVAQVAAESLMREAKAIKVVRGIPSMERLRKAVSKAVQTAGDHYPTASQPPQPWE
jgi:alkylation response protein AidB-like acyl-CoA dehydrogenase